MLIDSSLFVNPDPIRIQYLPPSFFSISVMTLYIRFCTTLSFATQRAPSRDKSNRDASDNRANSRARASDVRPKLGRTPDKSSGFRTSVQRDRELRRARADARLTMHD